MNTRILVILSLFVALGTAMHFVMPPFFFGVKPDVMLPMMFLGIILFPDRKYVLLLGIVTGLMSALTTGFPGGQIPNVIDKSITAFVFLGLFLFLANKVNKQVGITIITALGTMVSGSIFLGSAAIIVGLPAVLLLSLFLSVLFYLPCFLTVLSFSYFYPNCQYNFKTFKFNLVTEVQQAYN